MYVCFKDFPAKSLRSHSNVFWGLIQREYDIQQIIKAFPPEGGPQCPKWVKMPQEIKPPPPNSQVGETEKKPATLPLLGLAPTAVPQIHA